MLQDERQVSEQHKSKDSSYGEKLGKLVSKKVQHIKPADDLQKDEKSVKRKKIPASHEEAKELLPNIAINCVKRKHRLALLNLGWLKAHLEKKERL